MQDLRRVFDDKSIDAVSIATPNHWHSLAAIWAMQAGKDVYVEKPVSHNVCEGRRMVEAARKYGRICQTGTQCRSHEGDDRRDRVRPRGQDRQGEPVPAGCATAIAAASASPAASSRSRRASTTTSGAGRRRSSRSTRKQLHYDWHWFWDYGNGDLGNQGIHQMDIARWGLKKDRLADSVVSLGGRFGYKDDGETPNTQLTLLDYGDSQLIFECRGLKTKTYKGAKVGVIFHGTEGYVVLPKYDGRGGVRHERQDGREVLGRRRPPPQLHRRRPQPQAHRSERGLPRRAPVQRAVPPGQHLVSAGHATSRSTRPTRPSATTRRPTRRSRGSRST